VERICPVSAAGHADLLASADRHHLLIEPPGADGRFPPSSEFPVDALLRAGRGQSPNALRMPRALFAFPSVGSPSSFSVVRSSE
jgi:hypothetical protein